MSSLKSNLSAFFEDLREYADTRIALIKLQSAEKISALMGTLIAGLFLAVTAILFFSFMSIALAILLGQWLGYLWLGFIIVASFYLLLGIVVWVARKKLIQLPVMNSIIHQLFEDDEENKEHSTAAERA